MFMWRSLRWICILLPMVPLFAGMRDPRYLGSLDLNQVIAEKAFRFAYPFTIIMGTILVSIGKQKIERIRGYETKVYAYSACFLTLAMAFIAAVNLTAIWANTHLAGSETQLQWAERILIAEYIAFVFFLTAACGVVGIRLALPVQHEQ